ncbi:hypothetical protein [uncultured Ruminococcus sp.]|uniref:hypothetical protein n=1 Tax=uncultured Ruminococcus sp. TaxID=165186 RepID=UPI00260A9161|nr:hypothetical protein [uncultured Ruminococcus sp.]
MSSKLKNKKFVVTISYCDYTTGTGGTDKFILSQQRLLNEHGISVLHICPDPDILRGRLHSDKIWVLVADGRYYTMTNTFGVIRYMKAFIESGSELIGVILHHLNNSSVRELLKILKSTDAKVYMYLHDYYTVCPESGLTRNYREFCGISFPDEQKCRGCSCLKDTTVRRTAQISGLIKRIAHRTIFISPSQSVLENWTKAYPGMKSRTVVIPHQIPMGKYKENMAPIGESEPVRIAFVGYQAPHKGWEEWKEAVKRAHEAGCGYKFYQMGSCNENIGFVHKADIDFKKDIAAMTKALRANRIDCAVLWSLVPETYSFTLYEAYSANCFILTNDLSGNIAATVKEKGNGIVSRERRGLSALLLDEAGLRKRINSFREKKGYGPLYLKDNDEIVKILRDDEKQYYVHGNRGTWRDHLSYLFLKAYSLYTYFRRKSLK